MVKLGNDCLLKPGLCSPNASCVKTNKRVGSQWFFHQCACNPGYIGNGITCVENSQKGNGKIAINSEYLSTYSRDFSCF